MRVEAIAVRTNNWSSQDFVSVWPWSMDCFVNTQLDLVCFVKSLKKLYVAISATGILDLSPTQTDVSCNAQNYCLFSLGYCGSRNMTTDQSLCRVEQHAIRFTRL